MNSLDSIGLCAKLSWNWLSGFGEDENMKSLNNDDNGRKQNLLLVDEIRFD